MRLPPLRERREDIPLLARHFLQKSAQELGVEAKRLSDAALKYLQRSGFARQRAPAGKSLPLADRDGARPEVEIADLPVELREAEPTRGHADRLGTPRSAAKSIACSRQRAGNVFDGRLAQIFERILIRRALARHRRPAHRGRAAARHRPQHHHAQDSRNSASKAAGLRRERTIVSRE